jgi:hypothetical protein
LLSSHTCPLRPFCCARNFVFRTLASVRRGVLSVRRGLLTRVYWIGCRYIAVVITSYYVPAYACASTSIVRTISTHVSVLRHFQRHQRPPCHQRHQPIVCGSTNSIASPAQVLFDLYFLVFLYVNYYYIIIYIYVIIRL